MSSDVFVVSAARDPEAAAAISQAVKLAGVKPARIQDAIFGVDAARLADFEAITTGAGLACPSAGASSSMRAIFFGAACILSGDVELLVVIGLHPGEHTAMLLASPEAVGRYNLLPRARIAARSLAGLQPALQLADITAAEINLHKEGPFGALLLHELLDELEAASARWGQLSVSELVLLLECL